MYLSVKCLFDEGKGPVERDFVINVDDIVTYFDWVVGKYTAVNIRGTKKGDFPNWLYVVMPFAEFDALFKSTLGQSKPPVSGLPTL